MTQPSFQLNDVRVAAPCPVSWDTMTGDDRVRFCSHCQLSVYNFAQLTRAEAEQLLATKGSRICGRLYRRSDGTLLTKDCPVGLRALRRRMTRRATAVFATFLGLGAAVFGQSTAEKDKKSSCLPQVRVTRTKSAEDGQAPNLSGNVLDQNGAVLPAAKIVITNLASGESFTATSGDDGKFAFVSLAPGHYSLSVAGNYFKPLTIKDLLIEPDVNKTIDVTMEIAGETTMGIIAGPTVIDTPPGSFTISGDLLIRLPH